MAMPPLVSYTEMLTLRANDPGIELSVPIDLYDGDTVVDQAYLLLNSDGHCVAWFMPIPGDSDAETTKLLNQAAKEIQQIVGPQWQP
jgi:hypothetical protein